MKLPSLLLSVAAIVGLRGKRAAVSLHAASAELCVSGAKQIIAALENRRSERGIRPIFVLGLQYRATPSPECGMA
jgi:hypothetical protein